MLSLLIPYRKSNLWGYCTPDKTIVNPCEYDWTGTFTGDAAIVKMNDKYGAVNRSGKLFIPFSYTSPEQANREIYGLEDDIIFNNDPEMEDTSEDPPPEEGEICSYAGVPFVYAQKRYKAQDTNISPHYYEGLSDFFDGLIWVLLNNKWGAIDPTGKQIIPCMYDGIEPFDEDYPDYTFVELNGQWGIINHDNVQYWED